MKTPVFLKVKDHPGLVRDTRSSAILNTSQQELAKYREERDFKLKLQNVMEKSDGLEQDVAEIKNDMQEIKLLLQQLIKK